MVETTRLRPGIAEGSAAWLRCPPPTPFITDERWRRHRHRDAIDPRPVTATGARGCSARVALVAVVFLLYPLANAMLLAFVKNGEDPGLASLTLANFARFFTAASYQRALWNSIYSGVAATLLATLVALPMAYAVARVELPFRGLLCAMSVVPLISPPFIGAYAWIILLGKNGTITQFVAHYRLDAAGDLRPAAA